ncbi:MAG: hypothetical protein GEU28_03380 [Dehalococcoidia bacterium]|nr:hypothetical protein [Dehalococcoidia bacterium]
MSRERWAERYYTPWQEVPRRRLPEPRQHRQRGARTMLAMVVLAFFVMSLYTSLIVVSRVDQGFFPGNEISFGFLPGGGVPAVQEPEDDPIKRRINLLVMGVDQRPHDEVDARTDTIIVVTIDPATKTAGVLGVPRDLYVQIPDGNGGFTSGKINSANAIAASRGYDGPELVMETIEHNLGLHLDDYLVVDFLAFQDFVDAIGGVDVQVDQRVAYSNYSIDDIAGEPLTIEPGFQHMDGYTALAYSRYRDDSDFARIKRQQQIIFAAIDKAFSSGIMTDPAQIIDLYDAWQDTVDTNVGSVRMPGLALLAREIPEERITRASLGDAVTDGEAGGEYVARLVPDRAQEIIDLLFNDPRLINEAAQVEVLNASGISGLACAFRDTLVGRGVPEGNVTHGNAPESGSFPNTVVLVKTAGKEFTAQSIADWLDLNRDRIRHSGDEFQHFVSDTADIIVVLGEDVPEFAEGCAS